MNTNIGLKTSRICRFILLFLLYQGNAVAESASIRVLSFKDAHSLAVQSKLSEFEKETGVKVSLDLVPAASVSAKIVADQAGGASYDAYLVDEPFLPQLSRFLLPLNEWPGTDTPSEAGAFLPAAVAASSFRGKQYGIPVNGNVYMYIFRKDLFNNEKEKADFKKRYNADLAEPSNANEFLNVSEFFFRPPQLYGFAPFTKISEGTTVEAVWLFGLLGYEITSDKGVLVLTAAQASRAFDLYRKLMKFAPVGSKSWHHTERMTAYSKGSLAHMMTWPSFLSDLEDPSKSLVVGKTGYGTRSGASSVTGTWTYSVSNVSKQKAAAALFGRWWGGFKSGLELVPLGMNPARRDLLSANAFVGKSPWFPAVLSNFEKAKNRPRVVDYKEFSSIVSLAFSEAVTTDKSTSELATSLVSSLNKQLIGK